MIGGAFSSIVNSLVNDILMPLIGLLTGGVDLSGLFVALDFQSYPSIEAAQAAGVGTLNYGAFLQAGVNFLIIALVRVSGGEGHKPPGAQTSAAKEGRALCPYCCEPIHEKAVKCRWCGSSLEENGKAGGSATVA